MSPAAIRGALAGQLSYQPEPTEAGLDELSQCLAAHFASPDRALGRAAARLAERHPSQALCHLYAFAIQRELGDDGAASESLAALLHTDPEDPIAQMFALALAGERIVAASDAQRLANIAKLAATPLLHNPYQLAVGAIFDTIRDCEQARVLDVGVGSGGQIVELVRLLTGTYHRLRRLEIVGLDFVEGFLQTASEKIAAAAAPLGSRVEISFEPVYGKIEGLDRSTIDLIRGQRLDAANATIALHEVPGEHKLTALANLCDLAPRRLVIAEWNYRLENTMPATSVEFVFTVRSVAAAIVAALSQTHTSGDARDVVRAWLSQAGGQLTVPARQRQECFLDVTTWVALLDHAGFAIVRPDRALLDHADDGERASIPAGGLWVETSRYARTVPIALILATAAG